MLTASSSKIVGAMNTHVIVRSDRPRKLRLTWSGVASAARCAIRWSSDDAFMLDHGCERVAACAIGRSRYCGFARRKRTLLELTFLFEHLLPIGDELVERVLGCTLVRDDIVVNSLLHIQKKL